MEKNIILHVEIIILLLPATIIEAIELYLEAVAEEGGAMPASKRLRYYIDKGIFDDDQVAEEYYIARVEVSLPGVAA